MSEKMEVKRGTKIEDQATAKAGQLGILVSMPSDDVEGQMHYNDFTQCPYCGNIGYTTGLSTNHYINVVCGRCGWVFRA